MDFGRKINVGNFIMLKYRADKMAYIKISTVFGDWSVSYRQDNSLFPVLDTVLADEFDALHTLFVSMYGISQIIDAQFTQDVVLAMDNYFNRAQESLKKLSEEEHLNVVLEMKKDHEDLQNVSDGFGVVEPLGKQLGDMNGFNVGFGENADADVDGTFGEKGGGDGNAE